MDARWMSSSFENHKNNNAIEYSILRDKHITLLQKLQDDLVSEIAVELSVREHYGIEDHQL